VAAKQEFVDRQQELLDALERDIRKLGDQASSLAERTPQGVEPEIQVLETKRQILTDQLADLRADDTETWRLVQAGFRRSVAEFKQRLERATRRVRPRF
jgi:hypothetical protein